MIIYGGGKSGRIHRNVQEAHDPLKARPSGAGMAGHPVTVTDLHTGERVTYASKAEAARAMYCAIPTVADRTSGRLASPIFGRYRIEREEVAQ